MVVPRPLRSAMLLLALLGPVYSTPEIPSAFFEAQQHQQQNRPAERDPFAAGLVLRYEESFRAWMAEHGKIFRTREDFDDRLRIFAHNRYSTYSSTRAVWRFWRVCHVHAFAYSGVILLQQYTSNTFLVYIYDNMKQSSIQVGTSQAIPRIEVDGSTAAGACSPCPPEELIPVI